MKKSAVTGVAGSIRIDPLTLGGLAAQERHGKREDLTSQARAIRDVAPLITNGLDLKALYQQHIEGYFVPGGKTKVLHVLIQFPKDLVDLRDEAGLLHHALEISERIWGEKCIMAARYDRDERSQGVADVFVVPKYLKATKADPEGKRAVAMTRHGKLLAKKWKRMTGKGKKGEPQATPWDVGRALQDELYDYLKNVMKLDGVQRGEEKQMIGPDWKSPEELREAALAEKDRELEVRIQAQDEREAGFETDRRESERLRDHAVFLIDQQPEWEREARERGYRDGFDAGKAKAERLGEKALKADREALEKHAMQQAQMVEGAALMARRELDSEIAKAKVARSQAESERAKAREERQAVEAGLDAIVRGDIVGGKQGAKSDERLIIFRGDLNEDAKRLLRADIGPVWGWLSMQAERMANILKKRFEKLEERLAHKVNEAAAQLARNAARKLELNKKEATLAALIAEAEVLQSRLNSKLAPVISWARDFEAAGPQKRQVMEADARNEVSKNALSDGELNNLAEGNEEIDDLKIKYHSLINRKGKGLG